MDIEIFYIGNNLISDFKKNDYDIFFDSSPIEQLDVHNVIGTYDILIIEISENNIDKVLKWIFRLYCKKRIPVLAVLYGCCNADKLLLSQFGVEDYIEGSFTMQDMQNKIDAIASRINWRSSYGNC